MATNVLSKNPYSFSGDDHPSEPLALGHTLRRILAPVASLKLTVTLFALAIFIVLAGTVAQIDMDVWEVVHHYFRAFITWIPLRIFFPRTWTVPGGFYFPGLWTVGAVMCVNLLAAHLVRFKAQAKGMRLLSGLVVIGLGIGLTMWIIAGYATISWSALWFGMKLSVAGLLAFCVYRLATISWSRRLEVQFLAVGTIVLGALLGWLLFRSDFVPGDSSMRILWWLIQGAAAGVVLLAGCVLAFRKRAGIVLIHAGVGLMMFNELYVGLQNEGYFITGAAESQMQMQIGEVHNYVEDIRTVELAVVDPSGAKEDGVTVVPKSVLLSGGTIRDENLPFDVKLVQFLQNADLVTELPPGEHNRATAGAGLEDFAVERRAGTGVDTDSKADLSAAYVQLLKKNSTESLGTYLVSIGLLPQDVTVDGKKYQITLRFQRTYKPYTVALLDAHETDYPGTKKPQSYSSTIHLSDAGAHTNRDVKIWMNNPLRYNGETFYQSGFHQDEKTGTTYTVLSVVANRGWMIPYIGCMIVVVGLLAHFLTVLVRFLRRQSAEMAGTNLPIEVPATARSSAIPAGAAVAARRPSAPRVALPPQRDGLALVGDFFPWVVVAILVGWAASKAIEPRSVPTAMNLFEFGKLPVMYEGRVKPFDTLFRNSLMAITDKQTYTNAPPVNLNTATTTELQALADIDAAAAKKIIEGRPYKSVDDLANAGIPAATIAKISSLVTVGGAPAADSTAPNTDVAEKDRVPFKKRPRSAVEWGLDVISDAPEAEDAQVFNIDSPEIVDSLGLKWRDGHRYALSEFKAKLGEFDKQLTLAKATEEGVRNIYQKKVLELSRRLGAYQILQDAFRPLPIPRMPTEEETQKDPKAATETAAEIRRLFQEMPAFHAAMLKLELPLAVPLPATKKPADEKTVDGKPADANWEPFAMAVDLAYVERNILGREPAAATLSLSAILNAYLKHDVAGFNSELAKYRAALATAPPPPLDVSKTDFEVFFNHAEPFYSGMVLYGLAFVLVFLGFLGWREPLHRAAFWLLVATLAIHTAALIGRIYISGRPPVTTLYSAAVFIGWAAVILGLTLEVVFPLGIGILIAAVAGFAALLIAHLLAAGGDTFTVLQAVLDTQFWLATHVVCVTLGYATTFVAGLLGITYLCLGLLTPELTPSTSKTLARMIYAVVCFAIFFSFWGTVLGGLWADDSWGRFWGWDPKENGALIIVIWNALVLHARWDGMVKDRGLAMLAIGGNIAVAWSMFGVNELGVGLHSYGFTDGVKLALIVFVASQLAIIAAGAIPRRLWRSSRAQIA